MGEKPEIRVGDWITFGNNRQGVVSRINDEGSFDDIEIVYLDEQGLAIYDDMVWRNDKWLLKFPTGDGRYAVNLRRLVLCVEELKRGQSEQTS